MSKSTINGDFPYSYVSLQDGKWYSCGAHVGVEGFWSWKDDATSRGVYGWGLSSSSQQPWQTEHTRFFVLQVLSLAMETKLPSFHGKFYVNIMCTWLSIARFMNMKNENEELLGYRFLGWKTHDFHRSKGQLKRLGSLSLSHFHTFDTTNYGKDNFSDMFGMCWQTKWGIYLDEC